MSSVSYIYLAALISVVTFLPLSASANAGKILIKGVLLCNASCEAGSQSLQPIAKGIVGAEVRVACSNGTHYAQVQTRSTTLNTSDMFSIEGLFSVEWPKSEESMFSTDICAMYVDYIPDYITPKCNLALDPEQATKVRGIFNPMIFNEERIYIAGGAVPVMYYPPYGTQCP